MIMKDPVRNTEIGREEGICEFRHRKEFKD